LGGDCNTTFDAYYLLTFINILISILWLFWKKNSILKLEELPKSEWKITDLHVDKKD
jgi:hypothetical protein